MWIQVRMLAKMNFTRAGPGLSGHEGPGLFLLPTKQAQATVSPEQIVVRATNHFLRVRTNLSFLANSATAEDRSALYNGSGSLPGGLPDAALAMDCRWNLDARRTCPCSGTGFRR